MTARLPSTVGLFLSREYLDNSASSSLNQPVDFGHVALAQLPVTRRSVRAGLLRRLGANDAGGHGLVRQGPGNRKLGEAATVVRHPTSERFNYCKGLFEYWVREVRVIDSLIALRELMAGTVLPGEESFCQRRMRNDSYPALQSNTGAASPGARSGSC